MKWLILYTLIASWVKHQPTLEIKVTGGWVRGTLGPGGQYHQFLGIPYAHTDYEGRFKAPQPVRPWNGVLDAIEENVRCPQQVIDQYGLLGQVDCLRLNVYRPLVVEEPLPVMVFIHGGGFFEGSSLPNLYGPDYLVSKGVILVAMNYRTNILGFLCLGTKDAPGNAGMKDQVAALRWVQDNIAAFGGDKNKVTLFGESAGGVSVSTHLVSPMSKGLFHGAIVQSGSSLADWGIQLRPVNVASSIAKSMGFETQDPHEVYEYFMNKSDAELVLARVPRKSGTICLSEVIYGPCVETEIPGVEPFLTESPFALLSNSKHNHVPVIIGFNNEEGLFLVYLEKDTFLPQIKFEKSMPTNLDFPNEAVKNSTAEQFRMLYMGDEEISKQTTARLSKYHGELHFIFPTLDEIQQLVATSNQPVFAYKFAYDGLLNMAKHLAGFGSVVGATHADDLFYIFKPRAMPTPTRIFERTMMERMTTMWTNFAKYRNPTPEISDILPVKWEPVQKGTPEVFVIDQEFKVDPMWDTPTLVLWNQTYNKYRRK